MDNRNRIVFLAGATIDLVVINAERHLENACRWMNDPDVLCWLGRMFVPMSFAEEKKWFEKAEAGSDTDIVFAIETKDGEHIGFIGLHKINRHSRRAEIGITIGDKSKWGNGYATEAESLLIGYAFEQLGLHKLCAMVFEENPASWHAAEKNGAVLEGVLKDHEFRHGRFHELRVYAIFNPAEKPKEQ